MAGRVRTVAASFTITSPFRSVVPLRRLAIDPAVDDVRRRFEKEYGSEPEDRGGWYRPDDWYRVSFVLSSLRQGGRFLDVGLGAGQFINAVADTGWFDEIHGTDPTRFNKYVEFHDHIVRIDASIAELPYPDDHFDVVTCMEVLEHVPDDIFEASLAELRRVCRGQLLMSVPYEEPEPLSAGHARRFEADDIRRVFPHSERVLLSRPKMPWALMEEWCGSPDQLAPVAAVRLAAVEAVQAAPPAKSAVVKKAVAPQQSRTVPAPRAPLSQRVRRLLRPVRARVRRVLGR